MKLYKVRKILYVVAGLLGDIDALASRNPKKIANRAKNRIAGHFFFKFLNRK